MNLLEACRDGKLFAPWFERGDWSAWFAFIAAVFALPMTEHEQGIYSRLTGRLKPVLSAFREVWVICGRRAGKSFITALIGTFLAAFRDYSSYLQPGERATVLILACDRKQSRVIMRYIAGFFDNVPMLSPMVEKRTDEQIDLCNRVTIEIATASFRSTRGYTLAAVLGDETAFWRSDESANPDTEILNALRPGMATIPGAMMLCIGSPYARKGAMWNAYRQHYAKDDSPVLVWKAPTREMNPSVPQSVIDEAMAADPAAAGAEYMAEFRKDVETFIVREIAESAVRTSPLELPCFSKNRYSGFVDPSGGSADSMTMAIAHREGESFIIDVVRERKPPFSPESVVQEFCETFKAYGITNVIGDRYAGEWPRERFREHGIKYEPSAKPKSDLYRDMLPLFNANRIEIPPEPRLLNQLLGLERRTSRGGKDSIDHGPGGHDDLINAVAGACRALQTDTGARYTHGIMTSVDGNWQTTRKNHYLLSGGKTL